MTTSSPATLPPGPILRIEGLRVEHRPRRGPPVVAVDGVSLALDAGRVLALAGESGSGKSTLVSAVLGLRPPGTRAAGRVEVLGVDVLAAPEAALRALRGARVGYVGQVPFDAFDPLFPIGRQLREAWDAHARSTPAAAGEAIAAALGRAGLPLDAAGLAQPPHRMSGGMLQRAQVAAALLHRPALLVADEPTSALDTVQGRALGDLLRSIADAGAAVLLATHDLALARRVADEVVVLRDGREVERGAAGEVLVRPRTPYVQALVAAVPRGAA